MPARGRQGDRPRQSDPLPPAPRGPSTEPPRGGGTPTTSPPTTILTHRRPARPPPAPGAAKKPRPSSLQGGNRGATLPPLVRGLGRDLQATAPQPPSIRAGETEEGSEEPRRDPAPLSPPLPALRPAGGRRQAKGSPALYSPKGQGRVPNPPKSASAPRGKRR